MLKRLLICLTLLTSMAVGLNAQLPEPCPPGSANPTGECETSCIHCNFINGYQGTTDGQAPSSVPNYCGSIENDQWFGFIASCAAATFTASPIAGTCDNGDGIQIALYPVCGGSFLQCNVGCSGCGNTPQSISVSGMIPGQNYFLVIDGYAGDQCDFAISVIPPSCVQGPPVGPAQPITGPSKVCPGGTITYCTPNIPNAGAYVWTCNNPSVLLNGESGMVEIVGQAGNCVTVEFPANMPNGTVSICVKARNSCSEGAPSCRTITVAKILPTTAALQTVCNEDCAGFTLPDGSSINCNVGVTNYPVTYQTAAMCDSVVNYPVRVKPLIVTAQNKTICQGSCIDVGGQTFCNSGFYNMTIDSYQGCDSVINLNLTVVNVMAVINGAGPITCTNNPFQLTSANSSGTKTWTLNGAPSGSGNSINATAAGQYILTVQQTIAPGVTCIAKDTVDMLANTTPPTVTTTNGVLGCGQASTQITATTNAPTPIYNWPPGVTPTNVANPTASTAGNYTVTVTNTANGCTNTATSMVTGNTTSPSVSTTGATLTCTTTTGNITATANVGTVTYNWSAGATPNNVANPSVTAAGTYIVTVTNTANNCTATANAVVALNNAQPNAGASVSGNIGCTTPTVNLVGSSSTAGVTYAWPSGAGQTVPTSAVGNYVVTVTGTNGCTSTATAMVQGSTTAPGATAAGGTLTCSATQVQLSGGSTTTGVTYAWSGPGGATSPQSDPFVSAPGAWNLVVTNPSNGCTSGASATVLQDISTPSVSATGGILDCTSGQVTLSQSFSPSSSTLAWSGPAGFNSTTPSPVTTTAGTYTLVITGPNGCTSSTTASVVPDSNVPNSNATVSNDLDCINTSAMVTGSSTTPGATISVQPPTGGPTTTTTFTATTPGNYVYTVTAPNGCKAVTTVSVTQDIAAPNASANGATLTCTSPSAPISATSTTTGTPLTYAWTGPNSFMSTMQNPSVSDPGTYTVVITKTATGCTSTATASVMADQNTPVASAIGGTITCAAAAVGLQGSVSLPNSQFAWTGPSGFSSVAQNPTVSTAGNYILTTTSPNGCTDQATAMVDVDKTAPDVSAAGGTLTCKLTQVALDGGSTTMGVNYLWSGPNSFSSTQSDPTNASAAGTYTLKVTDPSNGCTAEMTAIVDADVALPDVSGVGGTITCTDPSITINASSTTTGAIFSWTGPSAFASTVANPSVSVNGNYSLTAEGLNGCKNTITVMVAADKNPPASLSATGGTITCIISSIQGSANSTTVGTTFEWFLNNASVGTGQALDLVSAGAYTIVATGPNGCTASTTASVVQNGAFPTATPTVSNILNCKTTSATLNATSSAPNSGFEWTLVGNPNPVSGTASFDVTVPGTYQVAVTDNSNGCKTVVPIDVVDDFSVPTPTQATGGTIDCISGSLKLDINTPPAGMTFLWTGPLGETYATQNPTVTNPGDYTCVVTKTANGCTSSATASVVLDASAPTANIAGSGILTCTNTSIPLTGSTTTPNSVGAWITPTGPSLLAAIMAQDSGTYVWTVVNTLNQCKTSATIKITEDTEKPKGVTATGILLTCKAGPFALTGNSTTFGASYGWTGPGGFTSAQKNPNVTVIGQYILTVTGPNGCTTTATAAVTEDKVPPANVAISPFTIDCINFEGEIEATTTSPGAFTYRWGNPNPIAGQTTDKLLVDVAGIYFVTITDADNGCSSTATQEVFEDIDPPTATLSVSAKITCAQPTVTVTATTAVSTVTYKWQGPNIVGANNTATITAAATGTYKVTVTNTVNGCIDIRSIVVQDDGSIPTVTVGTGTITCAVPTITLTAEANQPVTYIWNTTATTQTITVSAGGNYSVTVTNAATGCSASSGNTVLTNTTPPIVDLTVDGQFTCSDTIVGISSTVGPTGGSFTYEWSGPSIVGNSTGAAINTAAIGDYELIVTNTQNGCSTTQSESVDANDDVPSGLALSTKNIRCFGETNGFAAITGVTGGTPPYLYSLNGAPYSSSVSFQNLIAGTYSLGLEDVLGCKYVTSFDIAEPEQIVVNLGNDTTVTLGNSVTMDLTNIISPPSPDYTLNWSGSFLGCDTCLNFLLTPLSSQALGLTVIDSNGCRAQDIVFIEVDKQRNIYIPSIFAPESDDNNKFYIFAGIDCELIEDFLVYDRWGEAVSEYHDFQPNDPTFSWNGTYRSKNVNPGVYVYWARIRFIDGVVKIYKGDVTVNR